MYVINLSSLWAQTTYPGQIGVEVADRPTGFVDAFKDQGRLFSDSSGNAVPADSSGWPMTDGIAVVFDNRAIPAWAPPIDDPEQYQPECSGTYSVSFQGQATLSNVAGAPELTFANQAYSAATNTTTVNVTLPAGQPSLMEISFTNTQRTATSGVNTGITNLQVVRPGFSTSGTQIFDPAFLTALAPFSYLRFMGWLGTNFNPGYYGDTGHHLIQWADRSLPTDAFQGVGTSIRPGAEGMSWEYIILLANATNKDIWINIPISATGGSDPLDPTYDTSTDSYIYQLALLLKNGDAFTGNQGLNPGLHIYIEHSNEVWNWGFLQSTWNLLAAEDEVSKGNSPLNNDGDTNQYDWAYRRHAKRLYEIAQIFQSVFGAGSLNTTIRPVYAWWQLDEGSGSNAANVLAWFQKTYGPPGNYFYALAQGDYFANTDYTTTTTIPEVLTDMKASSDAGVTYVQQDKATASLYGLKLFAYEGGPDNSNGGTGTTTNIGVQIEANRDPGMNTLLQYHIRNNWFGQGGDAFGVFSLSTAYSRYGSWGATDDYRNLSTAKYNALINLLGYTNGAVPSAPGDLVAGAGNQQVLLSWEAVPSAISYNVKRSLVAGGPYTTLGTVSSVTYADVSVSNGTTYYYVVTATNSTGESALSNEANATPGVAVPTAPSLIVTAGNGQAQLTWTSVVGATSYNVYQGSTSGGESATPIATGITSTSYTASALNQGATYYFVVAAVNALGTGPSSNEVSVVPVGPPGAPTDLSAIAADSQATLNWTEIPGATSYNVYQGTVAGGEGVTPIATGVTATSYTATGLADGAVYYFTVAAVNTYGPGGYSNEASVTPGNAYGSSTPIPVPNNSFELDSAGYNFPQSWTFTSAINGGNSTAQYISNTATPGISGTNYWSPLDCGQQAAPYGAETATLTSAAPLGTFSANTQYTLTVALGSPDDGALSSKAIGFQFLANGAVVASYTAPVSGAMAIVPANGFTDYSLSFRTSSQPQVVGQNITIALLYTYSGQYCRNANFDNVRLTQAQALIAPPAAPTELSATAGDGQTTLNWTPVSGATSYNIYQGTAAGAESAIPVATGVTTASYTVRGLTDGTAYYFTVAAVGAGGVSGFSNEASATPSGSGSSGGLLAYEPFGDAAGALSGTSGDGDSGWASGWVVQNGLTDLPGYNIASTSPLIYPGLAVSGNYAVGGDNYAAAGRALDVSSGGPFVPYLSSGLIGAPGQTIWLSFLMREDVLHGQNTSITLNANGGSQSWWVQNPNIAVGYFGASSNDSKGNPLWSLQYNSTTVQSNAPVVLGQPAVLVLEVTFGTSGAQNQINLYVNPATLGGAAPATPNAQYATTNNLAFQSLAWYGGDVSGQSSLDEIRVGSSFAAVTPTAPITLPASPEGLTATAGSGEATLSWEPVAGAASYSIYQGATSGGEGVTPVQTGITGTSFTAQSLTNGTTYYFIVAAVNSSGVGAFSSEASATPTASAGIPIAPAGLTAAAGDGTATLSWAAVPGASTYNIYQGSASGQEGSTAIATNISATSYNITGLTDGNAYYFTIAAVNSYGVGPLSSEASATPAAAVQGTNAPADFSIYAQVMASNPVQVGFNMEPAAGTNITENAWLSDGGFSPHDVRMSFTASQNGTANTFIATGAGGTSYYSSIASGYFVGATARTYRYANGSWSLLRTDTVSGYTANSGSTAPDDNTITFASSGPPILSGDVTWLDLDDVATIPNVAQLDPRFSIYSPTWSTETQTSMSRGAATPWPYTLSTDVPAQDTNGFSLELTDTNTETNGIWQYIQGAFVGAADEQFQPGHNYEVDVWLKQSGISNGSVTFTLSGLNITHTFTGVTGEWQRFTWTFPAVQGLPANSVQPSVHLDFNAPGSLWVNNFQLYDAGWAPNTVSPRVQQAWASYHPGTMRIWSNFGNASQGYSFLSLDSWLTPEIQARNTPGIGNQYEVPAQLEHLPDALANVKAAGANPWLIVNMALSEGEWGELIDYLSAPAGVGYASRRPSGHPGPYTDDFNTIYLEVGNEEWGTQSVPVDFAYGQWAHFVASRAIANKSYFDKKKIQLVVNGFYLNPRFGSTAIAAAPEASIVDYALYSSGNTALSGDAYYQSDLVQLPATNKALIDGIVAQQQLDAASGRIYGLAAYEEGPGADTGAHPSDTSLAAAVGALDVSLYASLNGFGPQNFFMYQTGSGPFTSHSNFANGFRPHPVWGAMQMRNSYCAGPMVWVNANSTPTTTDGQASPLIGVYAFRDANNQADVVVLSRDLNNETPVTLHFPAVPTGNAQLYTLTGNPRIGNDDAMNIPIASEQVPVTKDYTFNMPPGSVYIFQVPMTGAWSTAEAPPGAPASLTAVADNAKVELTWSPSPGATGYNLQRATVSGGPYTQIASISGTGYTDTSVNNGTTYYYVVAATNPGGVSGNSPEASATPNLADAGYVTSPPPLDGTGGGSWANVPFVPLTHYFSGTSPDKASYKILWDATNLYVLVSVQDSTPVAPTQANIWSGDSVELYFSGTDNKSDAYGPTDFQYAFPYGNGGAVVTEADHNAVTGVVLGQQNVPGGYQMTIALPWTTLGTIPVAGQQYGFDVMVDDATGQGTRLGKLAWWGTVDSTWSNPSLMGPLVLAAQTSPSSLKLTASNAAPPSGSPVTLTAAVSGSGATPTGTVVFSAGATTLCTVALNSGGVATCSYSPAASGSVLVTAQYQGSSSYQASSSTLTLQVYDPSISLQLASTHLTYPGATNVTACIAPANNTTATGSVQIFDGSSLLSAQALQGNGCAYWYISPGLAAGMHVLTAGYSGDKNTPSGISASIPVTVDPVPVNMSVSCWNANFAYGANYQCTISASSSAGSPQGSITYRLDGNAAINVPLNSGNAQFTVTKPTVGNHEVVVGYAQQTNYAAAAPQTESFAVTAAPVVVALIPSTYYAAVGSNISFAATVSSSSAGAPDATGSISFYDGSALLGSVPVNGSGQSSFSTAGLAAGKHTITATYAGGSNYASGSASATITLAQ
jgi:fibronectin type 3 domain-containing protein